MIKFSSLFVVGMALSSVVAEELQYTPYEAHDTNPYGYNPVGYKPVDYKRQCYKDDFRLAMGTITAAGKFGEFALTFAAVGDEYDLETVYTDYYGYDKDFIEVSDDDGIAIGVAIALSKKRAGLAFAGVLGFAYSSFGGITIGYKPETLMVDVTVKTTGLFGAAVGVFRGAAFAAAGGFIRMIAFLVPKGHYYRGYQAPGGYGGYHDPYAAKPHKKGRYMVPYLATLPTTHSLLEEFVIAGDAGRVGFDLDLVTENKAQTGRFFFEAGDVPPGKYDLKIGFLAGTFSAAGGIARGQYIAASGSYLEVTDHAIVVEKVLPSCGDDYYW